MISVEAVIICKNNLQFEKSFVNLFQDVCLIVVLNICWHTLFFIVI